LPGIWAIAAWAPAGIGFTGPTAFRAAPFFLALAFARFAISRLLG
jgi:hypothetical protein